MVNIIYKYDYVKKNKYHAQIIYYMNITCINREPSICWSDSIYRVGFSKLCNYENQVYSEHLYRRISYNFSNHFFIIH